MPPGGAEVAQKRMGPKSRKIRPDRGGISDGHERGKRKFKFTQLTSLLRSSCPDLNGSIIGPSIGRGCRSLSVCARARPITNLIPDSDRILRELSYKSRPKRSRGASKSIKTFTLLSASVIIYRVYPYISQLKKKSVHLITTSIGPLSRLISAGKERCVACVWEALQRTSQVP